MKVIWICNNSPLNINRKGGGGWFSEMAKEISKKNVELFFCFPSDEAVGEHSDVNGQKYYTFKNKILDNSFKVDKQLIQYFEHIIKTIFPDVIHIWGTEFAHSLAMIKAAQNTNYLKKVVVHIQGFCLSCAENYEKGLPFWAIHGFTLRDLLFGTVHGQKRHFQKRASNEIKALKSVQNIIGRTNWDYAYTRIINPSSTYYHCGELIRETFYDGSWELNNCRRHCIFVSQASYPIKGLHYLLAAFKYVVEVFPDAYMVIAGSDVTKSDTHIRQQLKLSFYGVYIRYLLRKYKLNKHVRFSGPLNAEEMKRQFIEANVYVLPSTTENSPNSLGEAMLLGVPSVASYVGGIPNYIEDYKNGLLYPCEDYMYLAFKIMQVFDSDDFAQELSLRAKVRAKEIYNRDNTIQELINCYKAIYEN